MTLSPINWALHRHLPVSKIGRKSIVEVKRDKVGQGLSQKIDCDSLRGRIILGKNRKWERMWVNSDFLEITGVRVQAPRGMTRRRGNT